MKKVLVSTIILISSVAMAADWKISGITELKTSMINTSVDERGEITQKEVDYVEQRTRIKLTVKASEDLYGVTHFEMDAQPWGSVEGGRNKMGKWGADQVAVEVKNAYLHFRVPGIGDRRLGLTAGVQPFKVRPDVFLDVDGAGIALKAPFAYRRGQLVLEAGWGEILEGDEGSVGADLYYGMAAFKGADVSLGVYGAWERADIDPSGEYRGHSGARYDEFDLWWVGAFSEGELKGVNYEMDFLTALGEAQARERTATDIDYSGWLLRAVVSRTVGRLKLGLGGMYVHGDDEGDPDDFSEILGPYKSGAAENGDSAIIVGDWVAHGKGFHSGDFGEERFWGGIWGIRTFAEYRPSDWLALLGQIWYWGDTTRNGDTFNPYTEIDGRDEDEDTIGWEVNLGTVVALYDNLELKAVFGYLFAGDALKQYNTTLQREKHIEDPYVFLINLAYTF